MQDLLWSGADPLPKVCLLLKSLILVETTYRLPHGQTVSRLVGDLGGFKTNPDLRRCSVGFIKPQYCFAICNLVSNMATVSSYLLYCSLPEDNSKNVCELVKIRDSFIEKVHFGDREMQKVTRTTYHSFIAICKSWQYICFLYFCKSGL